MTEYSEFGIGSKKSLIPLELTKASNFDHDTPVPIEDAQAQCIDGFVSPVGGCVGDGPYLFEIPAQEDTYIVMQTIGLHVTAQVVRANDANLIAGDVVTVVNSLGTVMWEQVEVLVNDRQLNPQSYSNTHYKSYIESILSYDKNATTTHLTTQLFIMDESGKFEVFNDTNRGFKERFSVTKLSRTFDMYSPLTSDFLRANNFLAPSNKLSIKLTRAKDSFLLVGAENLPTNYKLKIKDMKLFYDRIRLRETIPRPRVERYLVTGTELKKFPIAQELQTATLKVFNGGVKPKTIIMGQVVTTAVEGTIHDNPFNFQPFNLNFLQLRVDGRQVPSTPYKPDFASNPKLARREYSALFRNTGSFRMDRGNLVDYSTWCNSACLFAWDLTEDKYVYLLSLLLFFFCCCLVL
jgi:hypothetical protein